MRLVWGIALAFLLVSVAMLVRAVQVHRRNGLPLPPSLLAGFALNSSLAFLIVPQFLELPSALRWSAIAVSGLLIAWCFWLMRSVFSKMR
jgi:hypothetical protein